MEWFSKFIVRLKLKSHDLKYIYLRNFKMRIQSIGLDTLLPILDLGSLNL
ncbi:hypothetical protein VCHENC01_3546 [Vibrio harveyi]|nr:hypothetical protein VCHENC01_3546 [Vibrio harveyi]